MFMDAGGCIFFIFFIVIIISVISNANKATKGLGGGSIGGTLLDIEKSLTQTGSQFTGTGTTAPGSLGSQYLSKRPPINWRLIRMNMTKEQINECFDMQELRQGVKKEDLPKYVHLERLRQYFSDAQLQDFIDLAFFENAGKLEEEAFQGKSVLTPLGQEMKTLSQKASELPASMPDTAPAQRRAEKRAKQQAISQPKVELHKETIVEEVSREFITEGAERETVSDRFEDTRPIDRFVHDAVCEGMDRDSGIQRRERGAVLTSHEMNREAIRNAIIWKEILTPPPMVQAYKSIFAISSIPTKE